MTIHRMFLFAAVASLAYTHPQPTTMLMLDVGSDRVTMNLHVPLNELELAFGHNVTRASGPSWRPSFEKYLIDHIRPASLEGNPWSVHIVAISLADAEQAVTGRFQEALVELALTPPAASPRTRNFILNYDLILHQVVTHKTLVSVQGDWAAGQVEPVQLGVIEVNTGTGRVEPLAVNLGEGSSWQGFSRMVSLGAEHIRDGTDHLLFLLLLLLPAMLTVRGHKWRSFKGGHQSLLQLVRIVTAFTLGHSVTLLVGALHWLTLPQQPVEVAIACSILITAIHAIRPIFPGKEAQVAAGFGLVHGLAFASVLADLKLAAGAMAQSILGFNIGIELMQIFVIVLTMPWLLLLSLTPAYPGVRVGGASLAAIAALSWIANRLSGKANAVEQLITTVTPFAPLGILLLAVIAMPAYLYTAVQQTRRQSARHQEKAAHA
jgi:hypothetical protein